MEALNVNYRLQEGGLGRFMGSIDPIDLPLDQVQTLGASHVIVYTEYLEGK